MLLRSGSFCESENTNHVLSKFIENLITPGCDVIVKEEVSPRTDTKSK